MRFELKTHASKEEIEEIRTELISFNQPFLKGVKEESLALFSYDEHEQKIAGITAEIFGEWLLIKLLWVKESHRGQHLATQLISQLEQHAVGLGCGHAHVDTFSFQAKPFYEKQGYQCQMTLDNYPVSTAMFVLTKALK
ncbi:GNAT family N-acetyltransferase [Agarivorans sp. 1_MG-2023]|uniref:GNAT family N-acetyltransferase n=1 Tax=Agarivorans sp. 1_MG-2023 TaxID=3062634 RepID=UPI0026E2F0E1|nr:GNAT family N-acetyltransferase [Agarivorans sp. 1_MG-2023]MDO6765783.1 GNAT family N-acetyltransferase [Agarivorans sp. 1_MG-2023]